MAKSKLIQHSLLVIFFLLCLFLVYQSHLTRIYSLEGFQGTPSGSYDVGGILLRTSYFDFFKNQNTADPNREFVLYDYLTKDFVDYDAEVDAILAQNLSAEERAEYERELKGKETDASERERRRLQRYIRAGANISADEKAKYEKELARPDISTNERNKIKRDILDRGLSDDEKTRRLRAIADKQYEEKLYIAREIDRPAQQFKKLTIDAKDLNDIELIYKADFKKQFGKDVFIGFVDKAGEPISLQAMKPPEKDVPSVDWTQRTVNLLKSSPWLWILLLGVLGLVFFGIVRLTNKK